MKLTKILAGSAIASLALFATADRPKGLNLIPAAEAATSVSFSVFYDGLSKHGSWVRRQNAYVFVPARVRADWRPYVDGHWVYVETYGWTWASDEPFGWATYHYGRWGFEDDIGWYWVPGTRWAPAWVSWRRSNDYVVWAPLPPRGGDRGNDVDVSININVGDIPDFYWVAVPTREFLVRDIRRVAVRDTREVRRVIQRADFIGTPRVRNNVVVNTVIDIDIIEKETGRKVRRVEARRTNDPREARAGDEQVTVFEGEVKAGQDEKPQRLREVSDIRKERRDRKQANPDTEDTTTTGAAGAADQPATENTDSATGTADSDNTDATKKKRRNTATDQQQEDNGTAQSTTEDSTTGTADSNNTDATKKKRRNTATDQQQEDNGTAQSTTEDSSGSATSGQAADESTQPAQKKKQRAQKKQTEESGGSNAASQEDNQQAPANQQTRRKKAKQDEGSGDATGSTTSAPADNSSENANQGKAQKRKNRDKNKSDCDPADPNCQPAQ